MKPLQAHYRRKSSNHIFNDCAVPVHFTAFITTDCLNILKQCVKSCAKCHSTFTVWSKHKMFIMIIFNCCAITCNFLHIVFTINPLREAAISVCGQSSTHPVTLWLDSSLNECLWFTGRLTPTEARPHTIWMHKEVSKASCEHHDVIHFLAQTYIQASCASKPICSSIKKQQCSCVFGQYMIIFASVHFVRCSF